MASEGPGRGAPGRPRSRRTARASGLSRPSCARRSATRLRRGIVAEHRRRRVAREHAHQKEHEHQRTDSCRYQLAKRLAIRFTGQGACGRDTPAWSYWKYRRVRSRPQIVLGRGQALQAHATGKSASLTIAMGTMSTSLMIFFCRSTYSCCRFAGSSSLRAAASSLSRSAWLM